MGARVIDMGIWICTKVLLLEMALHSDGVEPWLLSSLYVCVC